MGWDGEVKSHILFRRYWFHYQLIWEHCYHSYGIIIMVLAYAVTLLTNTGSVLASLLKALNNNKM